MGTNPAKDGDDDSKKVTEQDLRDLKYNPKDVDPLKEEDEIEEDDADDDDLKDAGEDDEQIDDEAQDDEEEDDADADSDDEDSDTFIKGFEKIKGDTLPEYTRNLEKAYELSSAEAKRLYDENQELKAKDTAIGTDDDDDDASKGDDKKTPTAPTSTADLYVKQQMDKEIVDSYVEFSKDYTQVDDPVEYQKFTNTVRQLSKTILDGENRIPAPRELYSKAAVILGWKAIEKKPTKAEKAGLALKNRAGISIKGAKGSKKSPKSKVSQAMIEVNRKMYPGKTDAEIRDELEPHVQ